MNQLRSYILEGEIIPPYYDLGLLYHDKGKHRQAILFYKREIARQAILFYKREIARQAILFYKREIARSRYWKARYNLGLILAKRKRYSEAIRQFKLALRKRPPARPAQPLVVIPMPNEVWAVDFMQ